MKVSVKTTVKQSGDFAKHAARIRRALSGAKAVDVGFPAGKAPAKIVAIATFQQFGTSRGIPPRPFMTVALFKGERPIRAQMRMAANLLVTRATPLSSQLPRLGAYGAQIIKAQIESNMPPPNAASTVAQKGHAKTLIDTGKMLAAVTWKLTG